MTNISIIVPVYNGAGTIPELHRRLVAVLERCAETFEVVFVEDCGTDDSWDTIDAIAARDPRVRGIRLSRNFGQHNALLCGIRNAQYETIVTLDDDLQNPPEEIPKLLAKLGEGFDVVYGTPEREQHGFFRDLASQITKAVLQNAMGAATARRVSAFRVFRTRVRDAFAGYRGPFVSIDVLLTWGTTRFSYLVVKHDSRPMGKSNYTMRKLVTHALNMMTGFSTGPLQLASIIGFTFTLLGFATLAYVLAVYFVHGRDVPGFAFLASVVAIFSGAQLFALGIIGEYLARMHFRSMDRPPYVVLGQAREAALPGVSRLAPSIAGASAPAQAKPPGRGTA
jgi:undecaprenyl-phosphate 4-deoxy-4-formamido-L-arabinose transferase